MSPLSDANVIIKPTLIPATGNQKEEQCLVAFLT